MTTPIPPPPGGFHEGPSAFDLPPELVARIAEAFADDPIKRQTIIAMYEQQQHGLLVSGQEAKWHRYVATEIECLDQQIAENDSRKQKIAAEEAALKNWQIRLRKARDVAEAAVVVAIRAGSSWIKSS